jgi:uncharacterized membrane protein
MDHRGNRTATILIAVVAFAIGVIGLYSLLHQPSEYQQFQQYLAMERAASLQGWNLALNIAWRIILIGVGIALLLGLAAAMRAASHKLDLSSRLIRPDRQTGQFPAVRVRQGEALVDLNRLPDGKAMTGVVGGKAAFLLVLFFRYVLRQELPELTQQPAIIVTPPNTSPEQMQITSQAQATQALAAASRGGDARQAVQVAQAVTTPARQPPALPPLLIGGTEPQEVRLLLDTARRRWEQGMDDDVVDVPAA